MSKYQVGDEVLVKAKITEIDGGMLPYKLDIPAGMGFSIMWVEEERIAGLASDFERKPEPKFKVGDKVIHIEHPEWGVGVISSCGEIYCYVKYFIFIEDQFISYDQLTPAGIP